MTNNEILEQMDRLQRQKDAWLQSFVLQTDPDNGGPVRWSMWSHAPDSGFSLGHGVHYHDVHRAADADVVAFIRGFRWQRHDSPAAPLGFYIQPDSITRAGVIADLKQRIETLIAARDRHYYPETWITDRIYVCSNC